MRMLNNFFTLFLITALIQILFFAYAVWKKTDKVTDLSYGLTFILVCISAYYINMQYVSLFKIILLCVIALWGLRLSIYLFIRILKTGRDKRFDGIREDFTKFMMFWILQIFSIYIILLPTTYILLSEYKMELNLISYIGLMISILGILIETIADYQKYVFKNKEENKEKWVNTGLWKYSRHPNYLGEIMVWVGIFIYCSVYINNLAILTIVSPIYIIILLLYVSGIPTLEKKYAKRYSNNKEYEKYLKETGKLFPKLF